ncbi:DUF6680 family protein [Ottowia thiooxydans]|uniref:DUF6680 domain-containing protein n=1 Tax=Ottowia thiooxydans TaxID=219182 RepID=A0ABV2Q599_9BURK
MAIEIDWSLRLADVLVVLATAVSPFIAVQASEKLRASASARDAREKVFHTLMSTRGARMTPDHVAALNRIDLVFPAQKFSDVSDAWNLYMRHLSIGQPEAERAGDAHFEKGGRLFMSLLKAMAMALNTPFSETTLQHNAYYPIGYIHNEQQSYLLRDAALQVLKGEQAIAIKPTENKPHSS